MRTFIDKNFAEKKWLQKFQQYLESLDFSPFTLRGYLYDLSHFHAWIFELFGTNVDFENIVTADIAAYRQYMIETKGMKPSSVNRRIQSIKRMFDWAADQELIAQNPADSIKYMKPPIRSRPKALEQKEFHALLRTAGQSPHGMAARNYALVQLLVQTGLRISEAASLKIADMVIYQRSGYVVVFDTKTQLERRIPLNAKVRRALKAYLKKRGETKQNEYLFLSKRGKPASVRTLQNVISRLAQKARIHASAQTLRHTFAINYLANHPGEFMELSELMGHESFETVTIYTS